MKSKEKEQKFKRLFFDIETSPNIVYSWNLGYDLNISPDLLIKERAIICICYKYEGDSKVYSLTWDKGNDKKMLQEFVKIINSADEVIGHNGDKFDIKHVRTRCIFHGIPMIPDVQSLDTLKLSRANFKFNSNKLNYIAQFLGLGKKIDTGGFSLWKEVMDYKSTALTKMVDYCKQDVVLLEKVYQKLNAYTLSKVHVGLHQGGNSCSCPSCASPRTVSNGVRITASGLKKRRLQCLNCGKYFSISSAEYDKLNKV